MSINKSVFNFLRQLTINVALRTFAAARRAEARLLLAAGPPVVQQAMDISWPPDPQQQTRRTAVLRPHAYYAGSANK